MYHRCCFERHYIYLVDGCYQLVDGGKLGQKPSVWAIEGITSPDGRVLGKMGHSERIGNALYKNVPGNYELHSFESAKDYYNV